MKWFCRLLSIYFMTLACLPCSDGGHEHEEQVEYTVSHDGEHEDCNDLCTPFCQCTCCGSIVLNTKQAAAYSGFLAKPGDRVNDFSYRAPLSLEHLAPPFRPPIFHLG